MLRAWLLAVYIVLMANPKDILRPDNSDPYAPWVVRIAKLKRTLLPWHWN